jgi:methylenetetrahydrofolate reductase (NADPH)
MTTNLQQTLASGAFVMTAEITPPLSTRPADLLERSKPLKGLADAVNVTDGAAARAHIDSVVAASLLLQSGVEPILQLTCRDRNRIALQSSLVGAAALGIENVLFLTGDDPKQGDQPDAKPVFDLDSSALAATAKKIRDEGQLPHGRKVTGEAPFFIGLTDVPIDPAAGWEPKSLARKVEAGAQFIQTQFCMDVAVAKRYMARLAEHGVTVPFLIGVAPLASGKSARFIKDKLFGTIVPEWVVERMDAASDPKAEGIAICVDIANELREIPGVAGVHIMAPLNEASIPNVITALRR